MANTPGWLRESNALGWIALIALVAVIGISTVFFDKAVEKPHSPLANQFRPGNPGR